jgi:hypothetical protein
MFSYNHRSMGFDYIISGTSVLVFWMRPLNWRPVYHQVRHVKVSALLKAKSAKHMSKLAFQSPVMVAVAGKQKHSQTAINKQTNNQRYLYSEDVVAFPLSVDN